MKGYEKALRKENKNKQKKFIHVLQLEYLTHKLRSNIYLDEKYAKASAEIADKKKKKIMEVGAKFGIKTIFDGVDINLFIKENFWNNQGLPNLQYKDKEQARVQGNYDCWYLLYRGSKIKYLGEDYSVISNNPTEKKILIGNEKRRLKITYNKVSLINNYLWK